MLQSPDDWRGSASVYGARLASVLFGAGLAVFAARMLGPKGQGEYATLAAGVDLGSQITNLGISSAILVLLSKDPQRANLVQRVIWWLALGWVAVLAALLFPLSRAGLLGIWWPIFVLWIPLRLVRLDQVSLLTALKSYGSISRIEFGGRLIAVGFGVGALLVFRHDLFPFVLALVLADLMIALVGTAVVRRASRTFAHARVSDPEFLRSLGRLGLKTFPLLLLPWVLIRSDLLLVRAFRGPAEAGLYSIAAQMVDIGFVLPSTLAGFAVPTLARGGGTPRGLLDLCRRVGLVLMGCSVLVLAFGKIAIPLVFGPAYAESYGALVLLLPGFVALSLETLMIQHFARQEYPSFLIRFWLIAVVLNLSLNVLLLPRFGMRAAAVTSSLAYGLVFVLVCQRFLRDTGLRWIELFRGSRLREAS